MFRRRNRDVPAESGSQGAELREMALQLRPDELGLTGDQVPPVWGLVMDTVMAKDAWHCLVVLADGTTSLYTSSAFGVIGAGAHPGVRRASDALLRSAESSLGLFSPAIDSELPAVGQVALRALTPHGQRVVTAAEDDLGHGRHPAAAVFHAAHEVIAEVRSATPP